MTRLSVSGWIASRLSFVLAMCTFVFGLGSSSRASDDISVPRDGNVATNTSGPLELLNLQVARPMDPSVTIAPFDAPPIEFSAVDGSVAAAIHKDSPWILYKGFDAGLWYYAPRWGRIGHRPDGKPAFSLTARVQNNPDGSRTWKSGQLGFLFELAQELPSAAELAEWRTRIAALYSSTTQPANLRFQPLPLLDGKMNVYGLEGMVEGTPPLSGVGIGASSTVAFAVPLTGPAAEQFYKQIYKAHLPPTVAIICDFKYRMVVPTCKVRLSGSQKKTFDYFSSSFKARASYFGLFNGSYERSSTRAELAEAGGLSVQIIGTCSAGAGIDKLTAAIYDRFITSKVGEWMKPNPAPVEAAAPGGYFGGVSYAMKEMNLSDTLTFDAEVSESKVEEQIHKLSFNFESAIGQFEKPEDHVTLIEDDRKLDFKVTVGQCEDVIRYVPVASYYRTTAGDPVRFELPVMDNHGGVQGGIIQWSPDLGERPTTAQVLLSIDFRPPFPSYQHKQMVSVGGTGVVLQFQPATFMQRTSVLFAMDAPTKSCAGVCEWKYVPPEGSQSIPVSGFVKVFPDQTGNPSNLPSFDIVFPFHPGDYTNGQPGGGVVKLKMVGILGDWKGKKVEASIQLRDAGVVLDWSGPM